MLVFGDTEPRCAWYNISENVREVPQSSTVVVANSVFRGIVLPIAATVTRSREMREERLKKDTKRRKERSLNTEKIGHDSSSATWAARCEAFHRLDSGNQPFSCHNSPTKQGPWRVIVSHSHHSLGIPGKRYRTEQSRGLQQGRAIPLHSCSTATTRR